MAAADLSIRTVERLASALDEIVAERWDEPDATYAWTDRVGGELDLRIGAPPATKVAAVAVTSVGISRRLDSRAPEEMLVRATVSVSCCHVTAVVRHPDGRVDCSSRVDGATVAMLRLWASLQACPGCILQREGARGPQRQA